MHKILLVTDARLDSTVSEIHRSNGCRSDAFYRFLLC